jgi:hypothetical protein
MMSLELAIRWAFIVAWVVVLDLLFLALRRLYLEAKRLFKRLSALAERPLPIDFAKAEADLARLAAALEQIDPLLVRFAAAVEALRRPSAALRSGGFVRGFPGPRERSL